MEIKNKKIIILGSGPAGCTAAIYAARENLNPILITGIEKGGQLTTTEKIENWPGGKKNLTGTKLMDNMLKHVKRFIGKKNIIIDNINKVNFKKKPFQLTGDNTIYQCESLIIATGASAKYLNIELENKFKGRGISVCATCDGFFYKNKKIAIIGGGNTAVEEAIFLSNIVSEVNIIHRKDKFSAEKILINRLEEKLKNKKIILHKNYLVKKILEKNNNIHGLILKSSKNNKEKKILVEGIFIAIGRKPNTEIFSKYLKLKNGYIKIEHEKKNKNTQTSIPGIFAAGDVMDSKYRQAITAAATGCMAAIDAKEYLESIHKI